jgi:hypothetical protein
LEENTYLNGPSVVEYAANGFGKSELEDPQVMTFLMRWLFENSHHECDEHVQLIIKGVARTRRQMWGPEKARRKKAGP